MKKPSSPVASLEGIVGLGQRSIRKTYYPELRSRVVQLELFRELFDAGNDLLLLVEWPSGRIIDANLPVCRQLGWGRCELLQMSLAEVLDPSAPAVLFGEVTEELPGGSMEVVFRRRDGGVFPVELTFRVTGAPDRQTGLVVARDITERRRLEQALRQAAQKAERANRAKSTFLAAASHDLRQPAQSLELFVAALVHKLSGTPEADLLAHVDVALQALRGLLDGILDISRLEAGLVHPSPCIFPLSTVMSRLADEYVPRAELAGVRLRVVPCHQLVHTDPVLLERILRNLLENAIRYAPYGDALLGCRRGNNAVRVAVIDRGIGIPQSYLQDIFDEFYQVANPARDRSRGLGLGLSIVRRLSELLNIPVSVESAPGKGSCFSVELPVVDAA